MFDLSSFVPATYQDPWNLSFAERLGRLKGGKLRVGYFYERPDSSTFRYRVYNMVRALEHSPNGVVGSFFHNEDYGYQEKFINELDVLVLGRVRYSGALDDMLCLARRRGIRILYDVDDLVFNTDYLPLLMDTLDMSRHDEGLLVHWFGYVSRMAAALKLTDGAITTNEFLAAKLRAHTGKPTWIVPNFLNEQQLKISDRIFEAKKQRHFRGDGKITIGYFSGSPSHNRDFGMVLSDLDTILGDYPQTEVVVAGYMDTKATLGKYGKRVRYFSMTDFITLQTRIGSTEINIAPLQDNCFTHCKSELKYFEAAVVGTVTIASPSYTFAGAIKDGVNAYLAKSYEWGAKMSQVIESYDALPDLIVKAREHAHDNYDWAKQWPAIEKAVTANIPS